VITVTRKLMFQPERYESAEISFTITDIPDGTDPEEISQELDGLFEPELYRAQLATSKDESDTSLYTWHQIAKEGVHADHR
jgi:hypothetical protein